jgi:hypothetical protein
LRFLRSPTLLPDEDPSLLLLSLSLLLLLLLLLSLSLSELDDLRRFLSPFLSGCIRSTISKRLAK